MSEARSSAEIKLELEAAKARAADLGTSINAHEAALVTERKELHLLTGAWAFVGTIQRLEQDLENAVRREGDASLPRVRVKGYGGKYEDVYIVTAVTPQQIRLRGPGEKHAAIFDHSGRTRSGPYRIHPEDLARILAEPRKGGKRHEREA